MGLWLHVDLLLHMFCPAHIAMLIFDSIAGLTSHLVDEF